MLGGPETGIRLRIPRDLGDEINKTGKQLPGLIEMLLKYLLRISRFSRGFLCCIPWIPGLFLRFQRIKGLHHLYPDISSTDHYNVIELCLSTASGGFGLQI